jgi:hypothetical protein
MVNTKNSSKILSSDAGGNVKEKKDFLLFQIKEKKGKKRKKQTNPKKDKVLMESGATAAPTPVDHASLETEEKRQEPGPAPDDGRSEPKEKPSIDENKKEFATERDGAEKRRKDSDDDRIKRLVQRQLEREQKMKEKELARLNQMKEKSSSARPPAQPTPTADQKSQTEEQILYQQSLEKKLREVQLILLLFIFVIWLPPSQLFF